VAAKKSQYKRLRCGYQSRERIELLEKEGHYAEMWRRQLEVAQKVAEVEKVAGQDDTVGEAVK